MPAEQKPAVTPEAFRCWRNSYGLNQTECAAALGFCLRTVQNWEAGTVTIGETVRLAMIGYDVEAAAREADRLKVWCDEANELIRSAPDSLRAGNPAWMG